MIKSDKYFKKHTAEIVYLVDTSRWTRLTVLFNVYNCF